MYSVIEFSKDPEAIGTPNVRTIAEIEDLATAQAVRYGLEVKMDRENRYYIENEKGESF